MGMLYALLCLPVSFGMGNMVQVNAIAQPAEASLRISPLFTAAVLIPALIFCLKQNSTGIGRPERRSCACHVRCLYDRRLPDPVDRPPGSFRLRLTWFGMISFPGAP